MTPPSITDDAICADPDPRPSAGRGARLLGVGQLGVGLALAAWPRRVAVRAAGPGSHAAPAWLVRVLGIRSVLQGTITTARPTGGVLLVGALVDATHAASMVPVLALAPQHRRAAGLSAATAVVTAVLGLRAADRGVTS